MKIAVLNASSQIEKNPLLFSATQEATAGRHEVVNLGVYPSEAGGYSYVQMAFCASLLLAGNAVDFVVTGCSSGMGMMLACNSFPSVMCGYTPTPSDAFLFAQINAGNAVSLPLGLNFGWAGELNLKYTLEKLFECPFGGGYPAQEAPRKKAETKLLKEIRSHSQAPLTDLLPLLEDDFIVPVLKREAFYSYFMEFNDNPVLADCLRKVLATAK